jgi:hypothetical protein
MLLREFTPNPKQIQLVPQSPIIKKTPAPLLQDSEIECLTEKIEISKLEKKIDELENLRELEANKTKSPKLEAKKTKSPKLEAKKTKFPTLKNIKEDEAKKEANFIKSIYEGGNNNKNNKNKYSKKINSKRSRRIRKHKRSAARRGTRK